MITSKNANNYHAQKQRGLKRKWEIIQERGGKCERCGYNNNLAAIDFHHRIPSEKEFGIDIRVFANTNLETLRKELDKCDMLCSNCHREIHNPYLQFTKIDSLLSEHTGTSFQNLSGDICPLCKTRFPKMKGKIYCSTECRIKDKKYPSIEEINEQYKLLGSYEKVAQYFNITRKIIDGIRKRSLVQFHHGAQ